MYRVKYTAWFEDPAIGAQYEVLIYDDETPMTNTRILDLWCQIVVPVILHYYDLAGPIVDWRFERMEKEDV